MNLKYFMGFYRGTVDNEAAGDTSNCEFCYQVNAYRIL